MRIQFQKINLSKLLFVFIILVLNACGGGSNNSTSSTSSIQLPSSVDLTQAKLLTDAELKTPAIIVQGAPPSADEAQWLQNNHQKIRSLVYDQDFSDLAFLENTLVGKRIVQLGESSHGTREFNQMKVRLIKYLHEKLGYNVIAMESSIIGCYIQDLEISTTSMPTDTGCIFDLWSTKDVLELFRYISTTRASKNPLRLAGFDVQNSSLYDNRNKVLPWIMPILKNTKQEIFDNAETKIVAAHDMTNDGWSCINAPSSDSCSNFNRNYLQTIQAIQELAQHFAPFAESGTGKDQQNNIMASLALQALQDRLLYIKEYNDHRSVNVIRDAAMAKNITSLATKIFPDEKIIVWAHNCHVSRGISGYPAPDNGRSMGSYLDATWKNSLYTIGFFMLRGETADNARGMHKVVIPPANSLEAYTSTLHLAAMFLPISQTDQAGLGDDWLHRPFNFLVWGGYIGTANDRLDNNFDAVIMIDTSHMPEYL